MSVIVTVGSDDPVFALARLTSPLPEPACSAYEVGDPPAAGAVHASTTMCPSTLADRFAGANGGSIAEALDSRSDDGHDVDGGATHPGGSCTLANGPVATELARHFHGRMTCVP